MNKKENRQKRVQAYDSGMFYCSTCDRVLNRSNFDVKSYTKYKLSYECKECKASKYRKTKGKGQRFSRIMREKAAQHDHFFCGCCKKEKPKKEFYSGNQYECKECAAGRKYCKCDARLNDYNREKKERIRDAKKQGKRYCACCKRILPFDAFPYDGNGKRKYRCKACFKKERGIDFKFCEVCREWKKKTEFFQHRSNVDGLSDFCRFCFESKQRNRGSRKRRRHRELDLAEMYVKGSFGGMYE